MVAAGASRVGAEPVGPEDATLLCATTPVAQLQIGALCRFDGGPLRDGAGRLRVEDLHAHVASRLHLLPRFRQQLRRVPLDLARPVWVDDTRFDLDRHLRDATLPGPGGPDELRRFVADLLSRPLPSERPLWDLWSVDGLADGDVAVILRVHHVVADGLSLLRAAVALLDLEAEPPPAAAPVPWEPVAGPPAVQLLAEGLLDRGRHQLGFAAAAARRVFDPRWVVGAARGALTAVTAPPGLAPDLTLTGRVGTRRDVVWTTLPLAPLQELARSNGVTLNDVILAAVTGALRRTLGPTATTSAGRPPRVLVPVGGATGGEGGNAFSFVVTDLPVHLADPRSVLEQIHADMAERKASRQAADLAPLFSVVDLVPIPVLQHLAPEVLSRQPFVNLAVTNLPGSPLPLHLLGARLRELHPIVTGVGNIACIVGVLSYCDRLGVGITVDPDVVPDADGLLHALEEAGTELIEHLTS